jgi:hypothetical protein
MRPRAEADDFIAWLVVRGMDFQLKHRTGYQGVYGRSAWVPFHVSGEAGEGEDSGAGSSVNGIAERNFWPAYRAVNTS